MVKLCINFFLMLCIIILAFAFAMHSLIHSYHYGYNTHGRGLRAGAGGTTSGGTTSGGTTAGTFLGKTTVYPYDDKPPSTASFTGVLVLLARAMVGDFDLSEIPFEESYHVHDPVCSLFACNHQNWPTTTFDQTQLTSMPFPSLPCIPCNL